MENRIRMLRISTEKAYSQILWHKCSVHFEFRTAGAAHPDHVPRVEHAAVCLGHQESECDWKAGRGFPHLVTIENQTVGGNPLRLMNTARPGEASCNAIAALDCDRASGRRSGRGYT